jgi:hypothetical protein
MRSSGRTPFLSLIAVAVLSGQLSFWSQPAAADIRVVVPAECPSGESDASTTGGLADRSADARFLPRRLGGGADLRTLTQPNLEGPLVSAAAISNDILLVANYHNIQSLDIHTGAGIILKADLDQLDDRRFVPTGLTIGPKSGSVFVANYLANNVLIGHLKGNAIFFDEKIVGDGLISPENISVSRDESWLVAANYDGNSATAFRAENGKFVRSWKAEIPLAHGVAILGQHVFVSSLQLRKILILNLRDGTVAGSFGEPGWNAHCLNFLWPTGLQAIGDRAIIITDAHTGGVYRVSFDGQTLKLLDVIGGTAPGVMGLQMPYATTEIGGDLAILSTFSPKIAIAGPDGATEAPTVKEVIVQQSYQTAARREAASPAPLGVGWNGYINLGSARLDISGIDMVPSYGALESVMRHGVSNPDRQFSFNPVALSLFGSLMYFIEARVLEDGVILSSPSAPYALYVTLGPTSCFAKLDLPGPPLATPTGLEHRLGVSRYDDLEKLALARLRELDARRGPNGFLAPAEIAKSLGLGDAAVAALLNGDWGRQAADRLGGCGSGKYGEEECRRLVAELKDDVVSRSGSSLFELLVIDSSGHRCVN